MGRNRTQETRGKIYEDFGNMIRSLREKNNMTQEELANKIGISRTNITQYESGVRKVPLNIVKSFADFFNVSVDYLIGNKVNDTNIKNNSLLDKLSNIDFTDEEITKIYDFAMFLKSQNK